MKPTTWTTRAVPLLAPVLLVLAGLTGCKSSLSGSDAAATSPSSTGSGPSSTGTRPAAVPSSSAPSAAAGSARATRSSPKYAFPVRSARASFGRFHHDYPAADIFAPCGTSVVAPTDGVISEVTRTDRWSAKLNLGANRGGLSFSIVGADGVRYYGSHLRSLAGSTVPGRRVRTGELLGQIGNTGDARGIACHLHFGLSPACGKGDWWVRRGAVSPYPFLKSWQSGRNRSPVKAVSSWRASHGCPKQSTSS